MTFRMFEAMGGSVELRTYLLFGMIVKVTTTTTVGKEFFMFIFRVNSKK